MEECIFCKIAAGKVGAAKICETKDIVAFLDIRPRSPGHSLVIPKKARSDSR
ncbi:MAG: HIT domain-containing protein [Candidatus Hadarchaeota archaeon]